MKAYKFGFIISLVLSCGSPDKPIGGGDNVGGGQTGEELIGCLPKKTTSLLVDEKSKLGFSAKELLANFGGESPGEVTWKDGSQSSLKLKIEPKTSFEFVEYDWIEERKNNEIRSASAPDCPDKLEIEVVVSLKSEDGLFDESFETRLKATHAEKAFIYHTGHLSDFSGSYPFKEIDLETRSVIDILFETPHKSSGSYKYYLPEKKGTDNTTMSSTEGIIFGKW